MKQCNDQVYSNIRMAKVTQKSSVLQIVSVMKRTFQLRPTGLEIFFSGRNSLYLTFRTFEEREQ